MRASLARALANALVNPLPASRHLSLVIGLLHRGRSHVLAHGQPATPQATPPGEWVYEIGSITKLFTSALLAHGVVQGRERLEAPVPMLSAMSLKQPISLLQLATHTSGLPRLPSNLRITRRSAANPYARYRSSDLNEFVERFKLRRWRPGQYAYSNLGMGVLGNHLADRLRVSYEDAVVTQLCLPLGMRDTRVTLTPGQKRRWVQGHCARGRPVPAWDIPTLAGAGAFRSTVNDLLKFLAANLARTRDPLSRALRLCQDPQHRLDRNQSVGLGWNISKRTGRQLLWHNGATGGFNSFIGLLAEERLGVVVLANQGLSSRQDQGRAPDLATDLGVRLAREFLSHGR
ncbi:serine hydrolase domain-containing protein [Hyalangium sp.]|uniref:serine hydrolase domain-containing protein n=1 Tax=Hyalangium sp. TaxID=2028555 RepID=UPI002D4DC0DB|nr:serine hydrolase domain-containing protein [Hyalangium sp.]HYI01409.1 serine hydrolase domain-containing protein [Hyalangium sp.]